MTPTPRVVPYGTARLAIRRAAGVTNTLHFRVRRSRANVACPGAAWRRKLRLAAAAAAATAAAAVAAAAASSSI